MELIINGESRQIEAAATVQDVAERLGLLGKPIVAEADGVVLHASQWERTPVRDGMRIEFVHFVGGG